MQKYAEEIKKELKKRGLEAIIHPVTKNNDTVLTGLSIERQMKDGMEDEPKDQMIPVVYAEDFYEKKLTAAEAADDILEVYEMSMGDAKALRVCADVIRNWERAKERLVYRLMSKDLNSKFLTRLPHIEVWDLAVIFYIELDADILGYSAHVNVTNKLMENWGVTVDDLTAAAYENTPRLLPETLKVMTMSGFVEFDPSKWCGIQDGFPNLLILSNKEGRFGASTVLYPGVLKKIAEKLESDFFILPSSIHEVLISPMDGECTEEMTQMVQFVNEKELVREEILSDHVYIYHRDTDTVTF